MNVHPAVILAAREVEHRLTAGEAARYEAIAREVASLEATVAPVVLRDRLTKAVIALDRRLGIQDDSFACSLVATIPEDEVAPSLLIVRLVDQELKPMSRKKRARMRDAVTRLLRGGRRG